MHISPWRYFFLINSCQRPSSFSNFHHHLHNKYIFDNLRSLIPRPQFFFSAHSLPTYQVLFYPPPTLTNELSPYAIQLFNCSFGQKIHGHDKWEFGHARIDESDSISNRQSTTLLGLKHFIKTFPPV
jgi:hypothetical protein